MGLVQDNEPPALPLEQIEVGRPEQQVLQHGVIGQQQVRRPVPHLLPAEQLVRQSNLPRVERFECRLAVPGAVRGLAGVPAEGDVRNLGQQLTEPLELVVGERVHWIEQQRPHPGAELTAGVFGGERVQNRQQEALGLAGAGAGGHDQVAAPHRLAQRMLLMLVQGAVQWQRGARQGRESLVEHAFIDQVMQGGAGRVRRRGL